MGDSRGPSRETWKDCICGSGTSFYTCVIFFSFGTTEWSRGRIKEGRQLGERRVENLVDLFNDTWQRISGCWQRKDWSEGAVVSKQGMTEKVKSEGSSS